MGLKTALTNEEEELLTKQILANAENGIVTSKHYTTEIWNINNMQLK